MKIGDRIFVRGYVDEIRKDTVIVRNDGGYFGTIPSEVITGELPSAQPRRGKWIERNPLNSNKCRLIECDQCGNSYIVGFNVPYEHWIDNRNYCEKCGADMRGEQNE